MLQLNGTIRKAVDGRYVFITEDQEEADRFFWMPGETRIAVNYDTHVDLSILTEFPETHRLSWLFYIIYSGGYYDRYNGLPDRIVLVVPKGEILYLIGPEDEVPELIEPWDPQNPHPGNNQKESEIESKKSTPSLVESVGNKWPPWAGIETAPKDRVILTDEGVVRWASVDTDNGEWEGDDETGWYSYGEVVEDGWYTCDMTGVIHEGGPNTSVKPYCWMELPPLPRSKWDFLGNCQ